VTVATIAALVLVAGLVVVAVHWHRSWPELAFGIGALLAGSIANGVVGIESHPDSLASLGAMILVATLLWETSRRLRDRRRIVFSTAALVMVGVGAARSVARLAAWRDDEAAVEERSSATLAPGWDADAKARISEDLDLLSG
jgi:hypothetical protein